MLQNFQYQEVYKYLTGVCLNITDACNLACRYCFVEQNPHFMSLDVAKKSVDWLHQNLLKKRELNFDDKSCFINFFGGEPTLLWDDIIVPTILYAQNKYPIEDIKFSMTTNGTLFDKDKIDFFIDHNVTGILLSIDGYKITQDYNRPCRSGNSSFDMLIKNLPYILKNYPDVTFRATIWPETVDQTFANYLFCESLGFKSIFFIPDCRHSWTNEQLIELKTQINQIFYYRLQQYLNNQTPLLCQRIDSAMSTVNQIVNTPTVEELQRGVQTLDRCGVGTKFGSIGYDGSIYACQEQTSQGKNKSKFFIGDIYNGIDINLHQQLLKEYLTDYKLICSIPEKCNNCSMRLICNKMMGCPSTNYDLFNSFNIQSYITCYFNQILIDNCFFILSYLNLGENNPTFEKYLKNLPEFSYLFNKEKSVI